MVGISRETVVTPKQEGPEHPTRKATQDGGKGRQCLSRRNLDYLKSVHGMCTYSNVQSLAVKVASSLHIKTGSREEEQSELCGVEELEGV
jgi:hypothetical protein